MSVAEPDMVVIYQCFATGTKHKFRRFGTGIYSTSCSSSKSDPFFLLVRLLTSSTEADDYVLNGSNESSKYRVLLVSRVVVGKPLKCYRNSTNITESPYGHHSVCLHVDKLLSDFNISFNAHPPGHWRTWSGPQL